MRSPSRRTPALLHLVVLAFLALLCYWPMLAGRVPFPADLVVQFPPWESLQSTFPGPRPLPPHAEMGDLVTELYPWKAFTRRALASGTMPLWNPALFLGAPFQADPQTGLFYPVNLVYAALPTPAAWGLSFLIRTVLAGLLAALLARRLGASDLGALTAGVIFAFCGWTTAFQTRPHLDTVLWLPLVLVAVDRLERLPERASVALAGAAFALPVLAGQPESAAHVTLVGLLFFFYRLALPSPDHRTAAARGRFVALFTASGLLALGLAAVLILPTLEFIGTLDRGLDDAWPPKPLREMAAFLSRDLRASPNSAGVPIPEGAAYAGMLTLLLAPLALLHRKRRDAVFFVLLLAAALQIVYGFGPIYWLSLHTPVLRGIPNGRLLGVADLSLAILAALGMSALGESLAAARRRPARWWLLFATALVPCGLGLAWLLGHASAAPPVSAAAWARGPGGSAAALGAAALLLAAGLSGVLDARRFTLLAAVFCVLDLVTASYKFIPFTTPAWIYPPSPTMTFLRRDPGPVRVTSVDATYGSSFEMMYGLESAGGFNVVMRRTKSLLATLGFQDHAPALLSERIVQRRDRVLDLMNVKYLVATTWNASADTLAAQPERFRLVFSDAGVRVFENRKVLPRAFLVPATGLEAFATQRAQLDRVTSAAFDPQRAVVIDQRDAAGAVSKAGAPGPGRPGPSTVTRIERGPNATTVRLEASEPSILVLSQSHYPGWEAIVDGRGDAALRVNYALTGAAVPAGSHTVRFEFRPKPLWIGGAISAAALLLAAALGLRRRATRLAG